MKMKVKKLGHTKNSTLSELHIGDDLICYTLEDGERDVKVKHETCIPAGEYEVKLKTTGGFHKRYKERFKEIHEGMLHLQDVDEFTQILIHCGNTKDNTSGCLLTGTDYYYNDETQNYRVSNSTAAYAKLYKLVVDAAHNDDLTIEVTR